MNPFQLNRKRAVAPTALFDRGLVIGLLILLVVGLLMVASASVVISDRQYGQAFHYLTKQTAYLVAGILLAFSIIHIEMEKWLQVGMGLLLISLLLLFLVLIPGIGHQVNGSMRWLGFGIFNFQVSEFAKFAFVIYLAGFLVRHAESVKEDVMSFVKPLLILGVMAALLLKEPDFGAAFVITFTALGLLFLAGVRWVHFIALLLVISAGLVIIAISSPYRIQRLITFMHPWDNPFTSSYQLTQSLIAFGRGGLWGVGLGESVQKLFYLPEAHTDFIFAVLAEELGFVFALAIVFTYAFVTWRIFVIGKRAKNMRRHFESYICFGIGLWFSLQAIINIGVCTGSLPTKGLTLPLMSYGGSSLIINCIAFALILRIDYECRKSHYGI